MRVGGWKARAVQFQRFILRKQPIRAASACAAVQMSAFDNDIFDTVIKQDFCRTFRIFTVFDMHAWSGLPPRQVGGQYIRIGKQQARQCRNGGILQQRRTAFGNHHRVEYAPAEVAVFQLVGNAFDDFRRAEHSYFVGADVKVFPDCLDLCGDGFGRDR